MIRIGIIGAGGIARTHVKALLEIEDAVITAVYDVNRGNAEALASGCQAQVCDQLADCLSQADLVYILTPPSFRKALALEAIRAGKHVVLEKPIAIHQEDAQEIVDAAEQSDVLVMTAFNMRFRKGYRKLKEALDSGQLGSPITFWSQRLGMGVGEGPNWRTNKELLCGMSVESLSHDIDLIRWMMGDIVDVRAKLFHSRDDIPDFDNNSNVVMSLASGASAVIQASWSSHLGLNSRGIIGTEGTALVEGPGLWESARFRIKTRQMEEELVEPLDDKLDVQSYREESRHFIECVKLHKKPTITARDGLTALQVSHAILSSHQTNTIVQLDTK